MPKNIVLCSDGTGNAAGKKGEGTNVWKIFRAVDVHATDPEQLAFYDDGVGTDNLKFLRALGGAFGHGLKRNLRDLYSSLVHHYDPGDRIYLFGFSRGAFTVRSLAGLICRCGVVDRARVDGARLNALVDEAVGTYARAHRLRDPGIAEAFRVRHGVRNPEGGVGCENPRDIPIRCIGVWDTVDAVGLPVDEMTDALDKVFKFRFHKTDLHRLVENAFHALAIDDERHTFHPVMWDEKATFPHQTLEQVWFAGVHSNVGGGYPKDQMALVSLGWMMAHAENCGLGFRGELRRAFVGEANVHGRLYDSRSGLGAYYRYRPRNIAGLCADSLPDGGLPKIHGSVLERIRKRTDDYAPANIPPAYDVVDASPDAPPERHPERRSRSLELAWDLVWLRRVLYFGFVTLSGYLVGVGIHLSSTSWESYRVPWGIFDLMFDVAAWATPAAAEGAIRAFRDNPFWLLLFVVGFALALEFRRRLKGATNGVAVEAWRQTFGAAAAERPQGWIHRVARWIRTSRLALDWLPAFKKHVAPWIVAAAVVVLLAWGGAWLLASEPPVPPSRCGQQEVPVPLEVGEVRSVAFDSRCPTQATDLLLEAGERYRIDVAPLGAWRDETIPAGPDGFRNDEDARRLLPFVPFRRSWRHGWFVLLGSVGDDEETRFRVGAGLDELLVKETGRFHLFVNDAICYVCPRPWLFYDNNDATARVRVTHLPR